MNARGTLTMSVALTGDGGEQVTTTIAIPITVDAHSVPAATAELDRYLDEAADRILAPAARSITGIGAIR